MKTPETDNRIVDYLYDDLPDAERQEFKKLLAADEQVAAEVSSHSTLLKIYRDESEELTPSVAATEQLLRQAERAHQSVWARLLGDLIPRVVMRPAVGFAMVAVLLIGGGVFYVLSQGMGAHQSAGDRSKNHERATSSESDRTVASVPSPAKAPTSTTVDGKTDLAEQVPPAGAVAARDQAAAESSDRSRDERTGSGKRLSSITSRGGFYKTKLKNGALAAAKDKDGEDRGVLRGRRSRTLSGKRKPYRVAGRGAVTGGTRPVTLNRRVGNAPKGLPPQASDALQQKAKKTLKDKTNKEEKRLSPPALHNQARMNLAKGQVAVACRMFSSLVNSHRSYNRRADALLGWARCEMTRGSYVRAKQLAQQLIREYPKWKKTGRTLLARIQQQKAQAAYRAQRVRRRYRRAPARRRARPRARPSKTSRD